ADRSRLLQERGRDRRRLRAGRGSGADAELEVRTIHLERHLDLGVPDDGPGGPRGAHRLLVDRAHVRRHGIDAVVDLLVHRDLHRHASLPAFFPPQWFSAWLGAGLNGARQVVAVQPGPTGTRTAPIRREVPHGTDAGRAVAAVRRTVGRVGARGRGDRGRAGHRPAGPGWLVP